jgi:hypothetical protein
MIARLSCVRILSVAFAATISGIGSLRAQAPTTAQRTRELLSALAHDSLEGRATGTPGAMRAAAIIAREMVAIGLRPAGDDGYFQRVPARMVLATNRAGQQIRRMVRLPSFAALDSVPASDVRLVVNVLGILPGRDPQLAHEYVLVGAHYDHVGVGRPLDGDSIYNGADDDASGVVAVLEIARQLKQGSGPKRTLVFAAMTGEEVGLVGTRWYVDHPVLPLEAMAANLEIEMIGRPDSLAGGRGRAWLTGYERSTMGDALATNGIPIVADPRPDQNFFRRSDNIAFAMAGIPAHTLSSFNLHRDYHTPEDEVEKVDFEHMAAVINAAAKATRLLADGPAPQWKPGGRPCRPGEAVQPGVCS